MKTLPDIFFCISMLLLVALGIHSDFYFISILAGGILSAVFCAKLYSFYWNDERVRKKSKRDTSKVLTKKYRAARTSRTMPFKAGLLIALGAVISAFSYTTTPEVVDSPGPPPTTPEDVIKVIPEVAIEKPIPKVVIPKIKPKKKLPKVIRKVVVVPDATPVKRVTATFVTPETRVDDIILSTTEAKKPLSIPKPKPVPSTFNHINIDQMARFPGCEAEGLTNMELKDCADEALRAFFAKHIYYPLRARDRGLEGRVGLSFVIDESGAVTDIEILRDPGAQINYDGLGKEVARVVNRMPEWIPGMQAGKAVKMKYHTSVLFKLE